MCEWITDGTQEVWITDNGSAPQSGSTRHAGLTFTFVSRSPVWPFTFMVHPDLTFYLHRSPRQPNQQSYFILDFEMINHINITILLHVSIIHEFTMKSRMYNVWRLYMYLNNCFINGEFVYLNMYLIHINMAYTFFKFNLISLLQRMN